MKTAIKIAIALILAAIVWVSWAAQAQTPTPGAKLIPIAQPNAEQKARLVDLARAWDKEQAEANIARDKYMIGLLATMAELGLKPSETVVSWTDKGEPVFNRTEQAKTPPKVETKP